MKKIILFLALSSAFAATSSQARVCPDYTPTCNAIGMVASSLALQSNSTNGKVIPDHGNGPMGALHDAPSSVGKIIPDHGNGPMVTLVSKFQESGQTVPPIFPDPKIANQIQEWPYDLPAIDKLIITDTSVDIDELKRQLNRSEIKTGCNVEIDDMPTCEGTHCKIEKVSWLNCN